MVDCLTLLTLVMFVSAIFWSTFSRPLTARLLAWRAMRQFIILPFLSPVSDGILIMLCSHAQEADVNSSLLALLLLARVVPVLYMCSRCDTMYRLTIHIINSLCSNHSWFWRVCAGWGACGVAWEIGAREMLMDDQMLQLSCSLQMLVNQALTLSEGASWHLSQQGREMRS